MHTSRRIRRGLVLAAAAALPVLAAGDASAAGFPPGEDAVQGPASGSGFDAAGSPTGSAQHALRSAGGTAKDTQTTGNGATRSSRKAISHATQKAGAAVSEAPSDTAHQDLGTVSRVAAQAAPPSAPGVPEGLVIRIPGLVPGVPDIGVVPLSPPALPVTPGVPAL